MFASFSKVPKTYLPEARKSTFSNTRLLFDAPSPADIHGYSLPENFREYPHRHIARIIQSLGYIFVADSMGLSSFKFSWWAPKDARVFETECVMAIHGPRSLILAPIESE